MICFTHHCVIEQTSLDNIKLITPSCFICRVNPCFSHVIVKTFTGFLSTELSAYYRLNHRLSGCRIRTHVFKKLQTEK